MAALQEASLAWSSVLKVAPRTKTLTGDKILLPQSALEQLLAASTAAVASTRANSTPFDPFNPYALAAARAEQSFWRDTQQQLPQPLTFRLVNTKNGNVVHAGIREFSAEEGEVELSPFLLEALGIQEPKSRPGSMNENTGSLSAPIDLMDDVPIDLTGDEEEIPHITVHAKQLPKGTYVRLRPLEAGYNPEDWKSLLEKYLRENFTTLTNGEILTIRGSRSEEFRFLIDMFYPTGDGICVVDTDLEVDIEALNEEQARETLKQILNRAQKAPGTAEGSSTGGELDIWKGVEGQVLEGDYVDYQLSSWPRAEIIEVQLESEDDEDLDLFINPKSAHQRAKPRDDEHVWGDFGIRSTKNVTIPPTNIELEGAEALLISVHAHKLSESEFSQPRKFSLKVNLTTKDSKLTNISDTLVIDSNSEMHNPIDEQCKNCHEWVPKRTMMLHENFCLRNNVLCPHCENVFQKKSQEWQNHWHCPHDKEFGNTPQSQKKHNEVSHSYRPCPGCSYMGTNLRDLATHRTSTCPGKMILCQFCHLEVPQDGDPSNPSPETLISGLTAHEVADGARTTECHLCAKIIRLRDMATHLKHHDIQKNSRAKPAICRNLNCGRTLDGVGRNGEIGAGSRMGQGPGNELGLCSICFGPLYVNLYDPEGKAMKRRVERRYLSQLTVGCEKKWCANEYCKTARNRGGKEGAEFTMKDALPLVKPLIDAMWHRSEPMYFCVDEGSQKRRKLAELLAVEKVFNFEWCVAACEAESGNLNSARTWLEHWAPKLGA